MKKEKMPDGIAFQNSSTDIFYLLPFSKIRDTNSELIEILGNGEIVKSKLKYNGIFIDIFPLEKANLSLLKISKYLFYTLYKVDRKWLILPRVKIIVLRIVLMIYSTILIPFFRLISLITNKNKLEYRHTYGLPFFKPRYLENIFPLVNIYFEHKEYPAPNEYEKYLSKLYGSDYMKIPDSDKIKTHVHNLKFNK